MPPSCLLGGRKETTMKGKRSVCSRKNPCPINSGITMLWTALEGYEYCIGELMVFCIVFTPVGQMFLCWKMASSQRALKHNFNDSLDCFFFFFLQMYNVKILWTCLWNEMWSLSWKGKVLDSDKVLMHWIRPWYSVFTQVLVQMVHHYVEFMTSVSCAPEFSNIKVP